MTEWILYANFAAASSGLMAALLGFLLALTAPYVKRWERWYFCATFTLLLAYIASDLIAQASLGFLGPDFTGLSRVGVFLELLYSTMILPLITAYLLRCAGESQHTSPTLRIVVAIWLVYAFILIVAQFNDAVYSISADNRFVLTGPFYAVLVVPPTLLMIINLIALVRRWAALTYRQRIAFAIYIVVPLICILLQALFFDLRIIVAGTSLSTLAMFGFVLSDQVDTYVRQREEDAQRRAQLMTLQMRPHFIYNVMTSIYYLCEQDPGRAQQVTLDFTDYLRANFDAVAQEDEVPFSKELEHTRAYLAVEQARLESNLVVDINCPHTSFRLPPLTLQPLVENAVKHGADPELPPLHVHVSSREASGFSIVEVADTGPGFDGSKRHDDPASDIEGWTADPATALENISERLAAYGATLEISPREGGGTRAIIFVPETRLSDTPADNETA